MFDPIFDLEGLDNVEVGLSDFQTDCLQNQSIRPMGSGY
jgi:hypothetical protein